jgi:2-keto-4-pentenoate hydratase/2-oxohepta-3-ene-1,7-dioic acid hydratase in catechol pathway
MKLARFAHRGAIRTGIVTGEAVQVVAETLDDLINGSEPTPTSVTLPLTDVQLLAPLPAECRGVLCVGINYADHQSESADVFVKDIPTDPIIFFKTPSAMAAPDTDLNLEPTVSTQFDWEVELGLVIGRGGRNINADNVADHIFGYTVINDVTARDVQHRHKQWHLGKNVDASTPIGPWIVTADEFDYPPALDMTMTVSGQLMQSANTANMIFGITEQIAVVSRYLALRPGDVLATGTPAGVGFARTPARFLAAGDLMEATISGIGTLRNTVRAHLTDEPPWLADDYLRQAIS